MTVSMRTGLNDQALPALVFESDRQAGEVAWVEAADISGAGELFFPAFYQARGHKLDLIRRDIRIQGG